MVANWCANEVPNELVVPVGILQKPEIGAPAVPDGPGFDTTKAANLYNGAVAPGLLRLSRWLGRSTILTSPKLGVLIRR